MKKNLYTSVKVLDTNYNTFNMSHDRKQTFNMGQLVPCGVFEVLPGDVVTLDTKFLLRLAPMLAPMMHQVDVFIHHFYVPNRILWSNFPEFIKNTEDNPVPPTFDIEVVGALNQSQLADYYGLPVDVTPSGSSKVLAYIPAMYVKIWNEYYRDQRLQLEIDIDLMDGDNTALIIASGALGTPFYRAWTQDYFNTCVHEPQLGPAVTLPLGTYADLEFDSDLPTEISYVGGAAAVTGGQLNAQSPSVNPSHIKDSSGSGLTINVDVTKNTRVNLASALAANINDLRLSFKLQQYFELASRAGNRYTEYLRSNWNVIPSDASIQRPIYLGGSKSPLVISEVLQTSQTTDTSAQGTMAGRGISIADTEGFTYRCEEDGHVMSIVSIMPKPAYQQGLHRMWTRLDNFDYYRPIFQNLGEQAVLNQEIYFSGSALDQETFGYNARWGEYRDLPSTVHGMFKKELDFWHMGIIYDSLPVLNSSFIQCRATERIFAVQSGVDKVDQVWGHFAHNLRIKRKISAYAVPQII